VLCLSEQCVCLSNLQCGSSKEKRLLVVLSGSCSHTKMTVTSIHEIIDHSHENKISFACSQVLA